jgi:hypothetical protein
MIVLDSYLAALSQSSTYTIRQWVDEDARISFDPIEAKLLERVL